MNELYNPYDEEEYALAELEAPKRRRRKRKNPEPAVALGIPALLLVAYLGWCAYAQSKTKVWSWQPWKRLAGLKPRLQLRQANNEERRRAEFHRAVEKSMEPTLFTVDTEVPWRPVFADTEKERVNFIVP